MRLAEPDAGVDVQRIEHHGVAALGAGDLLGGRVSESIRSADDKGVERQARIEWGSAKRLMHAGIARRENAAAAVPVYVAAGIVGAVVRFGLWQECGFQYRRPHDQFDSGNRTFLGLLAGPGHAPHSEIESSS